MGKRTGSGARAKAALRKSRYMRGHAGACVRHRGRARAKALVADGGGAEAQRMLGQVRDQGPSLHQASEVLPLRSEKPPKAFPHGLPLTALL